MTAELDGAVGAMDYSNVGYTPWKLMDEKKK